MIWDESRVHEISVVPFEQSLPDADDFVVQIFAVEFFAIFFRFSFELQAGLVAVDGFVTGWFERPLKVLVSLEACNSYFFFLNERAMY